MNIELDNFFIRKHPRLSNRKCIKYFFENYTLIHFNRSYSLWNAHYIYAFYLNYANLHFAYTYYLISSAECMLCVSQMTNNFENQNFWIVSNLTINCIRLHKVMRQGSLLFWPPLLFIFNYFRGRLIQQLKEKANQEFGFQYFRKSDRRGSVNSGFLVSYCKTCSLYKWLKRIKILRCVLK